MESENVMNVNRAIYEFKRLTGQWPPVREDLFNVNLLFDVDNCAWVSPEAFAAIVSIVVNEEKENESE